MNGLQRFVMLLALLAVVPSAHAYIGFHFNADVNQLDDASGFYTYPGETAQNYYSRTDFRTPLGFGVDFGKNLATIFDLVLSVEGAYGDYDGVWISGLPANDQNYSMDKDTIPYWRAGLDVTGLFNALSFPATTNLVILSIGGGVSGMIQSKVLFEPTLLDMYDSASDKVKLKDVSNEWKARLGAHLAARAKLTLPETNFGFFAAGKYYFYPKNDEMKPHKWFTAQAGAFFEMG